MAYFQHGLSDTAWCFFLLGSKSLPFLLMKEGFDVWLGNNRGNIFSLKHKTKDPTDSNSGFFDYSIDEYVKYDLPATINYIKSKTGGKKMSYIAHSQGSTIFFMLYMENPTLMESSFDHFTSIGTVPNIAHSVFSPIKLLDIIYKIFDLLKFGKGILTLSHNQRLAVSNLCKTLPGVCETFFESGASIKPTGKVDYSKIYNFLYYYPGGTSKKNLLHWSQIHQQKQLVYYNPNYDKEKTAKPYNINNLKKWKIKALVARTDMDTFSSYEDVSELYKTVENKSYMKLLDLKNYNHLDVLSADSAYNDVFLPIVKFLNN
ncbi:MAG: alpha/beta fold hydrolase [Bacteroidales bacterium]|nr:alpha/beta fold hydrolase [Bacteroidales bacterium]